MTCMDTSGNAVAARAPGAGARTTVFRGDCPTRRCTDIDASDIRGALREPREYVPSSFFARFSRSSWAARWGRGTGTDLDGRAVARRSGVMYVNDDWGFF